MNRTGTALALAAAAVVGGACGDDDPVETDPTVDLGDETESSGVDWPGDGSETEVFDLGRGLVAELPVSWEVEPFEAPDPDDGPQCTGPEATLRSGQPGSSVRLGLHPAGCDSDDQIINGFHGTYASLDEVPDPREPEEHEVTAGSPTTFAQRYEEYTGAGDQPADHEPVWEDHVGLLELDAPSDPEHPTLMILDSRGDNPMADLVAVAEAISTAT